jgi:cold shock protein
MTVGTVRSFDVRTGYGFLKPDEGGVDVLVSICAVERARMAGLDQGQRLSFEVVHDERISRSCAENLRPATEPRIDTALPGEPAVDGRRAVGLTIGRPNTDRAREKQLRRIAERQGWRLRSRRGVYSLTDRTVSAAPDFRLSAEDVEFALARDRMEALG